MAKRTNTAKWMENPQKPFTIESYINTIEVFMRFYMILFFIQESKNTILIIKVCYKVCYFFAQKNSPPALLASGLILCFDSDFRQVDIIFRQPSKFNTSLRLSICSPSITDRLPLS